MIRYIYKLATCFILAIFFASCVVYSRIAPVPMAPPEKDLEAKQFTCPADKARIYVYRPYKITGNRTYYQLELDGEIWGYIHMGNYLMLDVMPGEHRISLWVKAMKSINAEAGKLYFIEAEERGFEFTVEQVSEEEGKKNIENSKLAMGLLK